VLLARRGLETPSSLLTAAQVSDLPTLLLSRRGLYRSPFQHAGVAVLSPCLVPSHGAPCIASNIVCDPISQADAPRWVPSALRRAAICLCALLDTVVALVLEPPLVLGKLGCSVPSRPLMNDQLLSGLGLLSPLRCSRASVCLRIWSRAASALLSLLTCTTASVAFFAFCAAP
jgi:hypothetical protein